EINKDNQALITQPGTVVLKFYADRCGPCKSYNTVFDAVAKKLEDTVNFLTIDIDAFPDLAKTYYVRSIPATVIIKNGVEVDKRIGTLTESQLVNLIN
ncbi:MAG: thioredoxin family protein, partial [Candidatus Taylorbacteria bacterium]